MSDFRQRQTTELDRIADSGLGYFNDLLGKDFGDGIGAVAKFERSQTILIGGSERSNVLGGKGRILQEPVDGHDDCPVENPKQTGASAIPIAAIRPATSRYLHRCDERRLNRGCGLIRQKTTRPPASPVGGGAPPTRRDGLLG